MLGTRQWIQVARLLLRISSARDVHSLSETYATVGCDGVVSVVQNSRVEVGCPGFDTVNFPFDTQACTLEFTSWSFHIHQLVLRRFCQGSACNDDALVRYYRVLHD